MFAKRKRLLEEIQELYREENSLLLYMQDFLSNEKNEDERDFGEELNKISQKRQYLMQDFDEIKAEPKIDKENINNLNKALSETLEMEKENQVLRKKLKGTLGLKISDLKDNKKANQAYTMDYQYTESFFFDKKK